MAPKNRDKVVLCTVGSGSLWKGIDVILKTAHILTESGILDFEWRLIGGMHSRQYIEYIEKIKFADVNATFVGVLQEDQLKRELTGCDIYVHPAYIDNSPNSLCEAMIMGVPCIASYVGGIPSLIDGRRRGKADSSQRALLPRPTNHRPCPRQKDTEALFGQRTYKSPRTPRSRPDKTAIAVYIRNNHKAQP